MSDTTRCAQARPGSPELPALEKENKTLRQENEQLKRQTEGVAEANARAAELMVQCEESNTALKAEIERRTQLEEELRQMNSQMDARVTERTAELTVANDQLAREIEERKQAENTLRESEERMHIILDSILTGVLIVDSQTHQIADVNPHAAEIIGLPRDRIVGKVCHNFVCPAEQGKCPIADFHQVVDRSERVVLKADGTRTPVLKTVAPVTWQGHDYLIESFVDISKLKQAEQNIKESLSLLEATLESTADGILVVDRDGKIKSFNKRFKKLWQIPDAVLESRNDDEALQFVLDQLKNPEAFLAKVRELYQQPEAESSDVLEFKDGRIIERYSKAQLIGDQIVGRVWSFRDVTRVRQAQQKQETLLRRVAEINEELTHFAYVVSHDLKAPLRGIKLITEWLCSDYGDKLGPEAKEQMDLLQSRVARMHNLIEGVLQYSRVGRIKEDMAEVDLDKLIPVILDAIAPPQHITITVEGHLPTITCEKTRVTQVFQNLLTNAVKFMDKPKGEIQVGCVDDGDFWKFNVTDNGPGIEERHFERIFKIFQTLAPRDEFESTGVGLTLVKKIVEMYGGRVWVESVVGQGSTFFFTFPKKCVAGEPQCAAGATIPSL
jgi:two-component system sensor kinase FixL